MMPVASDSSPARYSGHAFLKAFRTFRAWDYGTFSANGGIFRNRQLNHAERNAEPNAKAASVKA
jgi:hypothetical protein